MDEAHTLAIDAGQNLLHAVQRLGRKEIPVMLLLAGMPDSPRHLNLMEALVWGRSKILPLGLLKPVSAADAIRIPLARIRLSMSIVYRPASNSREMSTTISGTKS